MSKSQQFQFRPLAPPLVKGLTLLFALACLWTLPLSGEASDPKTPRALVEEFQEQLLDVMRQASELNTQERYDRLVPAVEKTFLIPFMARFTTSPFWEEASEENQHEMVKAFRRMSLATLATLFDGYSGQVFDVQSENGASQGRVLVETRIMSPNGDFNTLTYVTKEWKGRWWVVDVIVDDSITELMTRRSEYRTTLDQGGLPALAKLLNSKADDLLKAP